MPSSTSHARASSQSSLPPVLAQAPKLPRPKSRSKNPSPSRKPLHDRSNSQVNQHSSPTIRIVENQHPDVDVYSKFPVPTQPSQILPPPRHAPGYGFEKPGPSVSHGSQVANVIAKFEASQPQAPPPILSRRKAGRHSGSTSNSEADTLVPSSFSPSSPRFSQGTTPPSSPPPDSVGFEKGLEALEEESLFPSQRPTIRAVPPSSSGEDSSEGRTHAATPIASAASQTPTSNAGHPPSSSRQLSTGHEHRLSSEPEDTRPEFAGATDCQRAVLNQKPSTDSFAFSDISYTSIEPTHPSYYPSPTLHDVQTATSASGIRVDYPVVRAPSASSLRAESQNASDIASRMQDRRSLIHQWSSQLSTIPSVSERDSRSFARDSRSFGARSLSQDSYTGNGRTILPRRRRQTIGSALSSSDNVSSEGHTEFSAVPRSLFSPGSRASTEERDYHGEHMDTISPLPTTAPLRLKRSGYLMRRNSDTGSATDSRPSSSQSDISSPAQNNIPTWAKVYYRRGERISVGAPESESSSSIRLGTSHSGRSTTPSESNFPPSIYRPRNRPHNGQSHIDILSLSDDVQSVGDGNSAVDLNTRTLSCYSTPHLRRDRRGHTRYSAWKAPSLDNDLHTTLFGRQNRQILLFCLGFIFPPGKF